MLRRGPNKLIFDSRHRIGRFRTSQCHHPRNLRTATSGDNRHPSRAFWPRADVPLFVNFKSFIGVPNSRPSGKGQPNGRSLYGFLKARNGRGHGDRRPHTIPLASGWVHFSSIPSHRPCGGREGISSGEDRIIRPLTVIFPAGFLIVTAFCIHVVNY